MENNLEIQETELQRELRDTDARIKEAKEQIDFANDIEALHKIPEFQRVILKGYFEKEPDRILGVLVDPHEFKRDTLLNLEEKLGGIRNLKKYIGTQLQTGDIAERHLEELEDYRKQVTSQNSFENQNS